MSLYWVQQCLFDHLRRLERPDHERAADDVVTEGYDLDAAELAALQAGDIVAFRAMRVHPVLIHAYCRANGYKRADYRVLFPVGSDAPAAGVRWRGFGSRADGRLRPDGTFLLSRKEA